MYVKVIVINDVITLDRAFTYKLSEDQGSYGLGKKVLVPFGMGNKHYQGFIIGKVDHVGEEDAKKIKKIFAVVNDGLDLTLSQLKLAGFLRTRYMCTFNQALSVLIPKGTVYKESVSVTLAQEANITAKLENIDFPIDKKSILKVMSQSYYRKLVNSGTLIEKVSIKRKTNERKEKVIDVTYDKGMTNNYIAKLSKQAIKQRELMALLSTGDHFSYTEMVKSFGRSAVKKIQDLGYIEVSELDAYRVPGILSSEHTGYDFDLNINQDHVYQIISNSLDRQLSERFLLHGITGSGKTEVYMKLMDHVIEQGKQGIVLVPEIALTPQIVKRFHSRFGDKVAILHSKLSNGERFDQWRRINTGEVSIIVGARSAIFAPCKNIGLIVIDEEHENTYKSDVNPKYKTVEIAEYLAGEHQATLLLGSATPSIESYSQTENGNYRLLELKKRFNNKPLPPVDIIDMREELTSGNKSIFSQYLIARMTEVLQKGEQVILFLNRKGYATFVACRSCGYTIKCHRCDVSMTYHKKTNYTECSYCGYKKKVPDKCPECDSKYFKHFGTGTERIEDQIKDLFPDNTIARLDSVSTSQKGHLEKIVESVENREVDILIGTQMITKGLDFENVTLVGVLSADVTLNLPDFVSSERTFQLLTQVAGRAGRGLKQGQVIIQTYNPDHYAVMAAQNHDFDSFYKEEIKIRALLDYPPYKKIAIITVAGKIENVVAGITEKVYNSLMKLCGDGFKNQFNIYPPGPAVISRINNKYRYKIIIKYDNEHREDLAKVLDFICVKNKSKFINDESYISINIDANGVM